MMNGTISLNLIDLLTLIIDYFHTYDDNLYWSIQANDSCVLPDLVSLFLGIYDYFLLNIYQWWVLIDFNIFCLSRMLLYYLKLDSLSSLILTGFMLLHLFFSMHLLNLSYQAWCIRLFMIDSIIFLMIHF